MSRASAPGCANKAAHDRAFSKSRSCHRTRTRRNPAGWLCRSAPRHDCLNFKGRWYYLLPPAVAAFLKIGAVFGFQPPNTNSGLR